MFTPFNLTIFIYLVVIFAIGIRASFTVSKLSDFVLADRKLSGPITALGAGAADMSGWLLMAMPGLLFTFGINQIWLPLALSLGAYINWKFVAKRLRIYTEVAGNALTIPSYFNNRFPSNNDVLRVVTALVIIIFFTFYAAAGFVMCARVAEQMFGISYNSALIISSIIMISYTCLGGFLAVNWIDFFQGILMFLCLVILPVFVTYKLGGFSITVSQLQNIPEYLNVFSEVEVIEIISLVGWGLGYFGQVHILARFMAIRAPKEIGAARKICMSWMMIAMFGAVCSGLVGRVHYGVLDKPETVFIRLAIDLFNPWVAGLLISAVLSAIMSSITAQLLNAASALVEDIYHKNFRPKAAQLELLWMSRLMVFIIACIAVYFAGLM